MQILIERDAFADAVAWTARALPARPTVPVLAGMRLHASTDELTLSSFDYDVSAQATIPVTTQTPGSSLVSGRLLATMPEDEYPALPEMPPAAGSVGSDAFATAVSQTAVAAGRDDTLPSLTGVRIEIDGENLTLISTDRYRLAVRDLRWNPVTPDLSAAMLVPAKALTDSARSLTSSAEVSIALALPGDEGAGGDGMIGFEGAGRRTTTRLLGGEFPRYQSLLPSSVRATAELAAPVLMEAVRRVALVAERNTPVRLTFSSGQLVLEAGAGDEAQADEVIEAGFDGEELTIAFNPQYLLDGLAAIESDTARIAFTEAGKPALITGKPGPDGGQDYRYLLMPIRLTS